MNTLVKYDAARYALQQAVAVDEVKDIRDKAQAMAMYAKQAKDTELVQWATEIKVRAERRAGQMLAEMPKNEGAVTRSRDVTALPKTLAEIGISKNQSSRWQKLAAVPEDQFEQAVAAAKEVAGEVTTSAMLRIERANTQPKQVSPKEKDNLAILTSTEKEVSENEYSELDEKNDQIAALQDIVAIGYMDATSEDKDAAKNLISDLRGRVKILEATLDAITAMRDSLMLENKALKEQCKMQRKQLDKIGVK